MGVNAGQRELASKREAIKNHSFPYTAPNAVVVSVVYYLKKQTNKKTPTLYHDANMNVLKFDYI